MHVKLGMDVLVVSIISVCDAMQVLHFLHPVWALDTRLSHAKRKLEIEFEVVNGTR